MGMLEILSRNRVVLALFLALTIAGCAKNKQLPNNAAELGLSGNGAVPGSAQDFAQNVGDIIYFNTDSSVIRPDAAQILTRQIAWLNKYPNRTVAIEGHADERGTREYNLALGARRAAATRDFLISRGLSSSRVVTRSWGKERPVAVCDNISCWSQNRRAVTSLAGAGS